MIRHSRQVSRVDRTPMWKKDLEILIRQNESFFFVRTIILFVPTKNYIFFLVTF